MQGKRNIEKIMSRLYDEAVQADDVDELAGILENDDLKESILEITDEQIRSQPGTEQPRESASFDAVYNNILLHIKAAGKKKRENSRYEFRIALHGALLWSGVAAAIFMLLMLTGPGKSLLKRNDRAYGAKDRICEVRTPLGSRTDIRLGDGSQVSLNSGSVIYYDNNFNLNHREIRLEGEAYFKVAKNEKLPFIVSAGNMVIKATGTEFNIKAYTDEEIVETTLVEGSVEVTAPGKNAAESFIFQLHTNQKAVYKKGSDGLDITACGESGSQETVQGDDHEKNIVISNIDNIEQVVAWTGDRLVMSNEPMEELCRKLHRKYNVEISFMDEEIKSYRFSGILDDEPIEQVLEAINLAIPVGYTVDGKNISLYIDRKRFDK